MGAVDLDIWEAYNEADTRAQYSISLLAPTTIALLIGTLLGGLGMFETTNPSA